MLDVLPDIVPGLTDEQKRILNKAIDSIVIKCVCPACDSKIYEPSTETSNKDNTISATTGLHCGNCGFSFSITATVTFSKS